ncbi:MULTISPECIES: Lrp/AsnC family transcriptional regulator [Saccharopolyspora]|nr:MULTISPECIES: Lrp/AsnC family transcriptional regulator [Saccharopolyspora]MCA1187927.1 Lrp/AsnC family transcriptional regulator [Saccharopolyspora sp. 6T]MCA1195405.1 Lrp/AsnC family transcriptional regulator [Saccharopolyspora sp. 6V]MCA1226395.1 Lrp/AsnC family transcriptional regulator [Saccharopolyspora sp. 6M]MCA1279145.1 Lrp/AsnC family transcriptional regulator [Saccharopolyspora sp. 7B]
MSNQMMIDGTDHDILFHLRQDGRLTNVELAKRVGLTPAPCLRRVKRLEDDGIIAGYRARIDPAAVGRRFEVMVSLEISINDLQTVEELESTISEYDEVVEFHRLFGRPDYLIRVAVEDQSAFEEFLTGKLMALRAVARVDSHLIMRKVKSDD